MSATRRRLLRIDDAFDLTARGLVLAPSLPLGDGVCVDDPDALLRRGDGTERPCSLRVEISHLRRARGSVWERVCVLRGVAREEVAPGDELWCADDVVTRVLGEAHAVVEEPSGAPLVGRP